MRPNAPGDFISAEVRHSDIKHRDIRSTFLDDIEGVSPGVGE